MAGFDLKSEDFCEQYCYNGCTNKDQSHKYLHKYSLRDMIDSGKEEEKVKCLEICERLYKKTRHMLW